MRANDNPRPGEGASEFVAEFTMRMSGCRHLVEALTVVADSLQEFEKAEAILELSKVIKGRLFEIEKDANRILYPAYALLNEIKFVHAGEQEGHAA